MLKFLRSPVFSFNEQLLEMLEHEGGCNEHPYKRVFVNLIDDGLSFKTMARFREVVIRHIAGGLARVSYTDNNQHDAVITHCDYDRKELQKIVENIIGFLEGRFDPAATEEVV